MIPVRLAALIVPSTIRSFRAGTVADRRVGGSRCDHPVSRARETRETLATCFEHGSAVLADWWRSAAVPTDGPHLPTTSGCAPQPGNSPQVWEARRLPQQAATRESPLPHPRRAEAIPRIDR